MRSRKIAKFATHGRPNRGPGSNRKLAINRLRRWMARGAHTEAVPMHKVANQLTIEALKAVLEELEANSVFAPIFRDGDDLRHIRLELLRRIASPARVTEGRAGIEPIQY